MTPPIAHPDRAAAPDPRPAPTKRTTPNQTRNQTPPASRPHRSRVPIAAANSRSQLKRTRGAIFMSGSGSILASAEAFRREGRRCLGKAEFKRRLRQIDGISLGTTFVVAGFEPTGVARMFEIADPGTFEECPPMGFRAIGAGGTIATSSLIASYTTSLTVPELVYRTCEAKFLGESALGVGRKTFVLVVTADGRQRAIRPADVESIRAIWESKGHPPIPTGVTNTIEGALRDWKWTWPKS